MKVKMRVRGEGIVNRVSWAKGKVMVKVKLANKKF
jgi:hypothetical protein